jgi:hypothetical protein
VFGKRPSDGGLQITKQKTVSQRGNQQMDHFKGVRSKPIPHATSGVEVFHGKKKKQ